MSTSKQEDWPPTFTSWPSRRETSRIGSGRGVGSQTQTASRAPCTRRVAVTLQRDDEMDPPGPGTPVMDDVCLVCHGEHVFPMRPRHDAGWQAAIDLMTGTHLCDRDRIARPKASSLRSLRVFVSAIRTIRRARRRDQALRGRPPAESGAIGPSARAGAVGDIHAPRRRWLSSTADDARV